MWSKRQHQKSKLPPIIPQQDDLYERVVVPLYVKLKKRLDTLRSIREKTLVSQNDPDRLIDILKEIKINAKELLRAVSVILTKCSGYSGFPIPYQPPSQFKQNYQQLDRIISGMEITQDNKPFFKKTKKLMNRLHKEIAVFIAEISDVVGYQQQRQRRQRQDRTTNQTIARLASAVRASSIGPPPPLTRRSFRS